MDDDLRKRWIAGAALAGLVLVGAVVGGGLGLPKDAELGEAGLVPTDLQRRSLAALAEAGFADRVRVNTVGQHIRLDGTLSTREEVFDAEEAVEHVWGVTWVNNRLRIRPLEERPPTYHDLRVTIGDGRVARMQGEFPDDDVRSRFVDTLAGMSRIADDSRTRPGRTHAEYSVALRQMKAVLTMLDRGTVALTEGTMAVEGVVPVGAPRHAEEDIRTLLAALGGSYRAGEVTLMRDEAPPAPDPGIEATEVPEVETDVAEACDRALEDAFSEATIPFATGSAEITSEASAFLDRLVDTAQRCGNVALVVEGHTDKVGPAAENQVLSEQRAEAVHRAMVGRGFPQSRLEAVGFGEDRPRASNDTAEGRAVNRRIEMHVLRRD